jgi:hypothetical protein
LFHINSYEVQTLVLFQIKDLCLYPFLRPANVSKKSLNFINYEKIDHSIHLIFVKFHSMGSNARALERDLSGNMESGAWENPKTQSPPSSRGAGKFVGTPTTPQNQISLR